jgi:hypothetical protein
MTDTPALDTIYIHSDEVVAREIEGQLIIVPLTAGIGDMQDELYSLNDTGKDIWDRLDGIHTLGEIASELAREYTAPVTDIERDITGLVAELTRRRMLMAK